MSVNTVPRSSSAPFLRFSFNSADILVPFVLMSSPTRIRLDVREFSRNIQGVSFRADFGHKGRLQLPSEQFFPIDGRKKGMDTNFLQIDQILKCERQFLANI